MWCNSVSRQRFGDVPTFPGKRPLRFGGTINRINRIPRRNSKSQRQWERFTNIIIIALACWLYTAIFYIFQIEICRRKSAGGNWLREIISKKEISTIIFLVLAMRIPPAFWYFSNRNLPEEILPEEIISNKRFPLLYFLRQQFYAAMAHFQYIHRKRWPLDPTTSPTKKNKSRPHSVGVCGLVNSNVF